MMNGKSLLVTAAVVLALAGFFLYQWLGTAWLTVTSVPVGAEVRIDGETRGLTPFEAELSSGTHLVEVGHSHYAPVREQIVLDRGDRISREVILENAEGDLELLSNPKGAWVEIDGERISGLTPTRARLMSAVENRRSCRHARHERAGQPESEHRPPWCRHDHDAAAVGQGRVSRYGRGLHAGDSDTDWRL